MAECLLCKQEVVGSSPVSSTFEMISQQKSELVVTETLFVLTNLRACDETGK